MRVEEAVTKVNMRTVREAGEKRSRGVMVSTSDSESGDPSSNLGGT